jgi:hypothetical protein
MTARNRGNGSDRCRWFLPEVPPFRPDTGASWRTLGMVSYTLMSDTFSKVER